MNEFYDHQRIEDAVRAELAAERAPVQEQVDRRDTIIAELSATIETLNNDSRQLQTSHFTVLLQINSAISLLTVLRGGIAELPERQQRKMPGGNQIDTVIHRLEIAKAELRGEPWPDAPMVEHAIPGFDPADFIDN